MRYLVIFAIAIFGLNVTASAQNTQDAISKYFDKYMDDERFTVVYISSKMFDMLKAMDIEMEDEEFEAVKEVVSDIKGLRILVAEENTQNFYKEAKSKINTNEYEVLMTVRHEGDENVEFLIKDDGNTVRELLLLVGGQEDFVLMSFMGNINLDKVGKMIETFEDDIDVDIDNDDKDK